MIARLLIITTIWNALMAALLFLAAGTWRWPAGWVFLVLMYVVGLVMGIWLAKHDPALLAERLSPIFQRRQAAADKRLLPVIVLLWFAWMALMGLDAVRYQLSHVPIWVQGLGVLALFIGLHLAYLALRENSFAAAVIRIQEERGHKLITTGPYHYVRHPMYAGALLYFVGTPLLLGSWYGLAAAPLLVIALGTRILIEERTLSAAFPDYAGYARQVRYRLIPRVW